jgi:hypothetical protein
VKRLVVGVLSFLATVCTTAGVEASRLYPFAGVAWRHEIHEGREPDAMALARAGVAFSLGRVAVTPTISANAGHVEFGIEARVLLRRP